MEETFRYVRQNKDHPFFVHLCLTIPHANNEVRPNGMQVPSDAPYSQETWPQTEKNYAAMITRVDTGVGQLLALLQELGIDDHTLIFFSSDNGPHQEGGHSHDFFDSNGPLRGIKRDLYEGGIRIPMLARWPGRIKPGTVSDQVWAFWDFLPTMAELAGQAKPTDIDGISILPALLDQKPVPHPPLYWEFHERGFSQALRTDDWKVVKRGQNLPTELYDLKTDLAEQHDVAATHTELAEKLTGLLKDSRTDSPLWPIKQPAKDK